MLLVKQHRVLTALVVALSVLSMAEYFSEDMLTVIIQGRYSSRWYVLGNEIRIILFLIVSNRTI